MHLYTLYDIILFMVETLNKYERTIGWLLNELEVTKTSHPSEDVRLWLAMLHEAVEYNLSKTES